METYEQEIDLKWLLYRVLRAWRGIALWAVIAAVAVGVIGGASNLIKITDPEYVAAQEEQFERELLGE